MGGAFRDDLFYRINVAHLYIPPLRERVDDIGWFAQMFVSNFSKKIGKSWKLTAAGEDFLRKHSWPGNVRELKHAMERACIFSSQSILGPSELGASLHDERPITEALEPGGSVQLKTYLENCEHTHIRETLEARAWQISATAEALGISRKNLWEKMRKYGIRDRETTG